MEEEDSVKKGKSEWIKTDVNQGAADDWVDHINHPNAVIDYLNSLICNKYEKEKEKVKGNENMTKYYNSVIGLTKSYIEDIKSHHKFITSTYSEDDSKQHGGRRKTRRRISKRRITKRRKSKRRKSKRRN